MCFLYDCCEKYNIWPALLLFNSGKPKNNYKWTLWTLYFKLFWFCIQWLLGNVVALLFCIQPAWFEKPVKGIMGWNHVVGFSFFFVPCSWQMNNFIFFNKAREVVVSAFRFYRQRPLFKDWSKQVLILFAMTCKLFPWGEIGWTVSMQHFRAILTGLRHFLLLLLQHKD